LKLDYIPPYPVSAFTISGTLLSRPTIIPAVSALVGCGIQCVIAKSFAFIYARNAPNLGLLGIVIEEEESHEAARDGEEIWVYLEWNKVGGGKRE
jgi:3-isopropylmalate dehydratase small subunit